MIPHIWVADEFKYLYPSIWFWMKIYQFVWIYDGQKQIEMDDLWYFGVPKEESAGKSFWKNFDDIRRPSQSLRRWQTSLGYKWVLWAKLSPCPICIVSSIGVEHGRFDSVLKYSLYDMCVSTLRQFKHALIIYKPHRHILWHSLTGSLLSLSPDRLSHPPV